MPTETSALRIVARLAPWLAPLPSAWFISRSIYLHLLLRWEIVLPVAVNIAVAFVAGLTVELLAVVSIHNSLALFRWNDQGRVRREHGWERAPLGLSIACAIAYLFAAIVLLVLLEAVPAAARYAPMLFPVLTIVGGINLALLDQHLSRLRRYRQTWDLIPEPDSPQPEQPRPEPEPLPPQPERKPVRLSYSEFLVEYPGMASMSAAEIAELAGISERQARNWRAKGRPHSTAEIGRIGHDHTVAV